IIFFWTPPHFWALALRLQGDYAEAGVPMLPVTDGPEITRIHVVRYAAMLFVVTLMLGPSGELSWIYLATAVATGAVFVGKCFQLWRRPASIEPIAVYKYSMLYLALLFVSMGVDSAIFS
ncbi:MAG: UbiA family prenyltransferase, partial [Anaerolineaceae bacterium]